jgi:cytochrome c2
MKRSFAFAIATAVAAMFSSGAAYADVNAGKSLFEGSLKCTNCHNINDKKKVGPGLAGISKRATDDWIKKWLKDPPAAWNADDEYTKKLKETMKKTASPKPSHATRALTDQEIGDLLDFLKTL